MIAADLFVGSSLLIYSAGMEPEKLFGRAGDWLFGFIGAAVLSVYHRG